LNINYSTSVRNVVATLNWYAQRRTWIILLYQAKRKGSGLIIPGFSPQYHVQS